MRIKQVAAPTMLVALFGAVLVQVSFAIAERANDYDFFDTLIDIRHLLIDRYVERPDERAMQEAAIAGMLETLDDPHTVYVPPQDVQAFNKDLRGTYVGIGAEVTLADDYLTIVTPMDGSPALEAGMMAGDIVLEIEGTSTFQNPIDQSIEKLMGEPNTPVKVKVRHLDGTEEMLEIQRRQIVTRTVRGMRRLGEEWSHCLDEELGLAYVRVTQFNDATADELREVVDRLRETSLNGLVLDLRDDPGGELSEAVDMVDLFVDEGTIVSVKDRNGDGPTFEARAEGTLPFFPMVVLVNGSSASASEIVSGSLQDNGRARVLGTRSHGKGSVQEVRTLPLNRGTLKLTTAYYYLPSGRSIQRRPDSLVWGVDPDPGFLVPIDDEAYLANARARREFEIIRAAEADAGVCFGPSWIRENLKDEQLARATELLMEYQTTGAWPEADDAEDAGQHQLHQELSRALAFRTRRVNELSRLDERIQQLRGMTSETGEEAAPLIPDDAELVSGTITVRDAAGAVVGEFRIEGGDVTMALEAIELTPVDDD